MDNAICVRVGRFPGSDFIRMVMDLECTPDFRDILPEEISHVVERSGEFITYLNKEGLPDLAQTWAMRMAGYDDESIAHHLGCFTRQKVWRKIDLIRDIYKERYG